MSIRLRRGVCAAMLTVAMLGAAAPSVARAAAPQQTPEPASPEALLFDYDRVRIDPAEAAARVRATGRLTIQTPARTFDLKLVPRDLRAANYRAQATGDGGVVEQLEPGPVQTFRGTVRGMKGAEARFTITDEGVSGLIVGDDVWYYVEPERGFSKSAERASHIVYSSLDVRPDALGKCGTTLAEVVGTPSLPPEVPGDVVAAGVPDPDVQPVIELATEADFEYFEEFGSARNANQEILSILNQIEGVYRKQLGLIFRVTFQNVWNGRNDPYTSDDALETLVQFRTHWNANFTNVERDLAHLWTGRDFFDNTLGIAYTGVACSASFASYGLSQRLPSGPGKFILTAHEIGHNFSALHPDQQEPPVSKCDDTIMQSFVGNGFTFCKFSRNQVAAWLVRNSACLKNNHDPLATAVSAEFAGQGARVPLIAVGSDIDGDVLSYRWTQVDGPPATLTNAMSAAASFVAPEVDDETLLAFEVTIEDPRGGFAEATVEVTVVPEALPGVSVTSPAVTSVKVGKNLKIRWTPDAGLTGTLLVEVSRDGGATFETIASGVPAASGKRKWKVTGPKTPAAFIRITSEADPRSQSFSPAFAIQ